MFNRMVSAGDNRKLPLPVDMSLPPGRNLRLKPTGRLLRFTPSCSCAIHDIPFFNRRYPPAARTTCCAYNPCGMGAAASIIMVLIF